MRANGYVVSVEPGSGEWLITFATQKKGENYSDYIMVLSDAEVTLPAGTHATLYGTGAGTYKIPGDNDKTIVYPKISLAFFDEMTSDILQIYENLHERAEYASIPMTFCV